MFCCESKWSIIGNYTESSYGCPYNCSKQITREYLVAPKLFKFSWSHIPPAIQNEAVYLHITSSYRCNARVNKLIMMQLTSKWTAANCALSIKNCCSDFG